jgi:hypothetical protein
MNAFLDESWLHEVGGISRIVKDLLLEQLLNVYLMKVKHF